MIRGRELICEQTFSTDALTLGGCTVPIKSIDLQNIAVSVPSHVRERMSTVSQLGLKHFYLGKNADQEVRWNHARGVYTVGMLWLHVLHEDKRIPRHFLHLPHADYQAVQLLLGYALLLHDYGHLPFSHLLEEALESINWIPSKDGVASLEYTVLSERLTGDKELIDEIDRAFEYHPTHAVRATSHSTIRDLTHGVCATSFLQAIVNGAVDADKVDYIRRDQNFLASVGYPVHTRATFTSQGTTPLPWLNEFLSEQYVNHHGILCLPGRSALAAADLWRERLFLYDRFYLSPPMRAADCIAQEIVRQFLIRCVMSKAFADSVKTSPKGNRALKEIDLTDLASALGRDNFDKSGVDLIQLKYRATSALLSSLAPEFGHTTRRDWELLDFMYRLVKQAIINLRYGQLMDTFWQALNDLADGRTTYTSFAKQHIVGYPIEFGKQHAKVVRELARSLQHQYYSDVLIDVAVLPGALGLSPSCPHGAAQNRFAELLVPRGPIDSWGPSTTELQPLTAASVACIERPIGRLIVIAPPSGVARGRYIFDRLLSQLKQRDIPIREATVC